ncbi:MAG TPA: hypothetical protein VN841_05490 [Bryobacteraceae bacterium]|nr:hypothetical protein [Bryobacteraceae bacterium]
MKLGVMKAMGVAVVLAGSALMAQRGGSPQTGGGGFGRMINPGGAPAPGGVGFGRLIYPGTGGPLVARGSRSGGTGYIAPPGIAHPYSHGGAVIVPYPVFYGGGYYGYDAPPAPYAGGYYTDPSGQRQDAPAVILNQNFVPDTANPSFQDYSNVQLPPPTLRRYDNTSQPYQDPAVQAGPSAAPNDQPSVYLIALKDHTIYAAIGYWTEDKTLHYITPENVHNRVTLDQVDRAFTKQLNDERHVDFRLPE